MRTFEFKEGSSSKFWNIELKGKEFTVTFGRIGTKGQTQIKQFTDEDRARKEHDKLVREKLGKGYVETTPTAASAGPTPLQKSLEQALVENPDDLVAHSAYADYLTEQGDPRGEFISIQLALEDAARPAAERKELQQREKDLLKQHARRWLGDLGRFLVGKWSGPDKPYHYQFARGWLDLVRLLVSWEGDVDGVILAALTRVPEARLLRRLEVVYDMRYHPFDFDQVVAGPRKAVTAADKRAEGGILPTLIGSPNLTNLRAFKFGFSDAEDRIGHSTMVDPFGDCTAQQVLQLLQKRPRLEELYLNTGLRDIDSLLGSPALGNLRVLQYYYGTDYFGGRRSHAYPLKTLAKNASLSRLTHLRLHPGREATIELGELDAILRSRNLPSLTHLQVHMTDFGDDGVPRIVASGILKRLKVLDIGYGNMTDAGALALADCPDLKNLELLDVRRNALTDDGIAALQGVGIPVIADNQHEIEETDYLYEVDFE
jgi:uncharacterized protein (TIGR02996 family)